MTKKSKTLAPHSSGKEATLKTLKITGKVLLKILSYLSNILLTVILISLITSVIVGTVFAVYIKNNLDLEMDPSLLVSAAKDTTTRIYYMDYETEEDRLIRNGTAVELEDERLYGSVNSLWADYSDMPKDLINAFIAVEDHRFKQHNGVDWYGTVFGVVSSGFERGASTITQQLIKNLTKEDGRTVSRKFYEILNALNVEQHYSKKKIMEFYLNTVYLGNGCYGIRTAAEKYFGKDVEDLNAAECAIIASITKAPANYDPLTEDGLAALIDKDENGVNLID